MNNAVHFTTLQPIDADHAMVDILYEALHRRLKQARTAGRTEGWHTSECDNRTLMVELRAQLARHAMADAAATAGMIYTRELLLHDRSHIEHASAQGGDA